MTLVRYNPGFVSQHGKSVYAADDLVVRIVMLAGVANAHESMVIQTLKGQVLLRSIDGKKSPHAKPDIYVDMDSTGGAPVTINAH